MEDKLAPFEKIEVVGLDLYNAKTMRRTSSSARRSEKAGQDYRDRILKLESSKWSHAAGIRACSANIFFDFDPTIISINGHISSTFDIFSRQALTSSGVRTSIDPPWKLPLVSPSLSSIQPSISR